MIQITCTSCRTLLTIDDAFAGGVCRCQHCGTIQTVPKNVKTVARPAVPARGAPTGSKTLYQNRAHSDASSGLDDLASAVASSGLGSSRLRDAQGQKPSPAGPAAVKLKQSPVLWIVIGALAAAVVGLGLWIAFRSPSSSESTQPQPNVINTNPADNTTTPDQTGPAPQAAGPAFCGVSLTDNNIVYILDRGSGTGRNFDAAKAALYHSIQSLQPKQQYAVLLTDNKTPAVNVPAKGLLPSNPASLQKVHGVMDDAVAVGATTFRSTLQGAMARNPNVICILTGKYTLSPDDAKALKQFAQRHVKINLFQVGDTTSGDVMQAAAKQSGGSYHVLSEADLRGFGS